MLPCCFNAGLYRVILSVRKMRAQSEKKLQSQPLGEKLRSRPGPYRPEWLGLRGTTALAGLCLNAHTGPGGRQSPCFLPPPGETIGHSAICRCHCDLYLWRLGDHPGSFLGGRTKCICVCLQRHRLWEGKMEGGRVGGNQAARPQPPCCENHLCGPPLPPMALLCSLGVSDAHFLIFSVSKLWARTKQNGLPPALEKPGRASWQKKHFSGPCRVSRSSLG